MKPWAVVGLDLSLTSTGVAIITDRTIMTHRVRSAGKKDDTLAVRALRLRALSERIAAFVPPRPLLVVVEAPAMSRTTGSAHDRAGLWWSVVARLHRLDVPVAEVTPGGRAKYATGRGNAGKDEVLAAVIRRYPQADVTGNDVADALVLAAMGARQLGQQIDSPPQVALAAMNAVRWPETATP